MTEAWIDDLGEWVILDGQNGLYWHGEGRPLGLPELMEKYRAGEAPPEYTAYSPQWEDEDARTWWAYYGMASVGRTQMVRGGFAPHFEDTRVLEPRWIVDDPALLYPDLGRVDVGTANVDGAVGLRLHGWHPYVEGYEVGGGVEGGVVGGVDADGADAVWRLPVGEGGEHVVEVRARTRYGVVRGGSEVRWRVA